MKLRDISTETLIFEARQGLMTLCESIADYLSTVIAKLKAKKPEQLFDGDKPEINLDQLASIVAGLKVLGTKEFRQALTKDDIGIDPNSVKDFTKLLDSIPRDGKNMPQLTSAVFTALKGVAPNIFKKEREDLDKLKSDEANERNQKLADIQKFATNVNQIFNKARTAASQSKPAASDKTDQELQGPAS